MGWNQLLISCAYADGVTRPPSGQILAIDLVRFVCAVLVVAHHYGAMLPVAPPSWAGAVALPRDWAAWSWAGWVGVELFFVVSGYVIALSAADGSAGAFVRRRVLRLVPVAWICATITSAATLLAAILPWPVVLARWSASIVFDPFTRQADPSSWTLGIEISFYCLVATVLHGGGRRLVEPIGLVLAALSTAWWIGCSAGTLPMTDSTALDLALISHGSLFAIGIALAAMRSGATPGRLTILAIGLIGGTIEIAAQAHFMAGGLHVDAGAALPLAIFLAGIGIIAAAAPLQAFLARCVGSDALKTAGLATYPLYLIHQQAGFIVILWLTRHGVEGHVAMLGTAALALGTALAIIRWAEPPLRQWLGARIDALSRRGSAPDTPPTASLPAG